MNVLLMGNPNVGKSVLFSRLTGAHVIASNYPGTTVEFTEGSMRVAGRSAEVIDVPGTYTLKPVSKAEDVCVKMLDDVGEDDVVVNVVDSTNLERSLNLTLQLIKRGKRMVIALNFWDETRHTGVKVDAEELERILGVPCIPLVAITGVGVKRLVETLPEAKVPEFDFEDDDRWSRIGEILDRVQQVTRKRHTLKEKIRDATVHPFPGLVIALGVLLGMFEAIRFIGESLIGYVLDPLFEGVWAPLMLKLSGLLGGEGFFHGILIGKLEEGGINFGESFGLLTTGFYVPLAAVLPYVFAFYLVLSFLEDSGYLPRLAVLTDNVMHKFGLHGMGIVPMLLGLGCNVPGALAARIMDSRRERFISSTLMAIAVPCIAQISMIIGLSATYGAKALLPIFLTLLVVWVVIGMIMNKFMKGESPEILMDVPPYRMPYWPGLAKKVGMRIVWFIKEAVPWVLVGILAVNILYALGIISFIGRVASPVVTGLMGLPEETVGGLVVGFLRKDVAVGMLAPLGLSLRQIIVASVVLAMYFPCVATFVVMVKELGVTDMIKASVIMITSAVIVGGLLNGLLTLLNVQ